MSPWSLNRASNGAGRVVFYRVRLGLVLVPMAFILAGCAASPPPRQADAMVAAASRRGRNAFQAGSYEAAAGHYREALNRARMLNNRAGIGDNACNLAACLVALQRFEPARAVLREAIAEFEFDPVGRADALLMMARIAHIEGRPDEAGSWLDDVLGLDLKGADLARARAHAYLLRAALRCDAGQGESARAALASARRAAKSFDAQPLLLAEDKMLDGRILMLENKPLDAARRFDAAADIYERAGRPADVARGLAHAAAGFLAAGDPAAAADRRYRAARSLFAQGRIAAAVRQLDDGIGAAREARSPELEKRLRALLTEIEETVRSGKGSG